MVVRRVDGDAVAGLADLHAGLTRMLDHSDGGLPKRRILLRGRRIKSADIVSRHRGALSYGEAPFCLAGSQRSVRLGPAAVLRSPGASGGMNPELSPGLTGRVARRASARAGRPECWSPPGVVAEAGSRVAGGISCGCASLPRPTSPFAIVFRGGAEGLKSSDLYLNDQKPCCFMLQSELLHRQHIDQLTKMLSRSSTTIPWGRRLLDSASAMTYSLCCSAKFQPEVVYEARGRMERQFNEVGNGL